MSMEGKKKQASRRKYHYIYKTTCLITNKYYIGMHSTDNLEDGYQGSGKRLWYSINKYGKENHQTEILEFLPTRKELRERESYLVNEELLEDPMCMNLTLGGFGSWDHLNSNSDLQRKKGAIGNEKMKWLRKNDKTWVEAKSKKQSKALKQQYIDGVRDKGPFCDWTGKKHSEETIKKMKGHKRQQGSNNSQFGTCWIFNDNTKQNKKISKEDLSKYLDQGWFKGMKMKYHKK
jgi:hypothetical protein